MIDTDFADFSGLAKYWLGSDSSFWCRGGRRRGRDFTNDGYVGYADLKAFAEGWLSGAGE